MGGGGGGVGGKAEKRQDQMGRAPTRTMKASTQAGCMQ